MALKTIGTLATTTLQGFQFTPDTSSSGVTPTDFATLTAAIFRDAWQLPGAPFGYGGIDDGSGNKPGTILPGGFTRAGMLYIPGRQQSGPQLVRLGDWVAVDLFGNVFLIPQRALPKTLTLANCTTVSGSALITAPSSVIVLGWQNGTHITGTNIPSNSLIGDLAANGLTFNLYSNATPGVKVTATGSSSTVTITAGSFTHS